MATLLTNIDEVRARIMELESAAVFYDRAWQEVLADLRTAGRMSALADAERRMETAKGNQSAAIEDWSAQKFEACVHRFGVAELVPS